MNWITCENCETEFKVVSDSDEGVQFCPYCGSEIENEIEDEKEEDDDY